MFNLFKNWFSAGKSNANAQYKSNTFTSVSANKSFKAHSSPKQVAKSNTSDAGEGAHPMVHSSHYDSLSCRSSGSSHSDSYSSYDCDGGGDGGGD